MRKFNRNNSSNEVKTARWIARVLGGIPCFFFLIYFFGSLDELKLAITYGIDAEVIIPIMVLLAAGIIGYITSWVLELHGGVIMGAIGVTIAIYLYYLQGWDNSSGMFIYALPFVLSGLLIINCWRRDGLSYKKQAR